jgi:ornithine cyclodeaminase/alanine dehydrogenase-like protein (mu-crystallin family)
LHASYLLHDARTGVPLALIDGDQVTARRTAAASALAASWLARADARHLLVVGAGRVARLLPAAYRTVRPIERVTVWARRAAEAEALAQALSDAGVAARASDDLEQAVAAADVISVATLATEALIEGRWLRPGSHLDLIGGFTPAMREADDACFAGAALYVDTEEALQKSGDLLGPMQRGVFAAGRRARHARHARARRGLRATKRGRAHGVQVGRHAPRGSRRGDPGVTSAARLRHRAQPIVIRLALPPAAAVLMLSERSTTSRSSGIAMVADRGAR